MSGRSGSAPEPEARREPATRPAATSAPTTAWEVHEEPIDDSPVPDPTVEEAWTDADSQTGEAPTTSLVPPPIPAAATQPTVVGTVVTFPDGTRFAVGEEGDTVLVGDWDCDGLATAAVLRPASGEVFVFRSWPGPSESSAMPAAAVVPGAESLEAAPTGGADLACADLHVRAGGTTQVVHP